MIRHNVTSNEFVPYGKVIPGIQTDAAIEILKELECPTDSITYKANEERFYEIPIFDELRDNVFGGMPIQIGYCNGHGRHRKLNCLEYHRGSEVIIAATDIILLLTTIQEIKDGKLDTSNVRAFFVPAGTIVLLYETTLHYAPCTADAETEFRTAIVLFKGTNTEKPTIGTIYSEDTMLRAKNKWLLCHEESREAREGAYIGLTGENISLD